MTPITEVSTFDANVNLMDITDPVLGGVAGETNNPLIGLTNRTRWLYDHLQHYDVVNITSSTSIVAATHNKKLLEIIAAGNIGLVLDDIANFSLGDVLIFKSKCADKKAISITPLSGQNIVNGRTSKIKMWMCDAELLVLMADTDGTNLFWTVVQSHGNFYNAGEDLLVRKMPFNSIVANGCNPESYGALLNRNDFARLWDAVKDDAIPDSTWLGNPFLYRGFFGQGDGATTFRVPDLRSMFQRALDLGRGVDFARPDSSLPGGYEADDIKAHTHPVVPPNSNDQAGSGKTTTGNSAAEGTITAYNTGSTGGPETNVKNIGKIPVILY